MIKNLILLAACLGTAFGWPELPPSGFGSGPGSGGITLDSYAAPIATNGNGGGFGGSYPNSGGAPPVYGPPSQAPVIHKHVYVHVPPPEPTYNAPKRPQPPPQPPQKHYKIVFIKAPTPPPPVLPEIPQIAPPAEQKTLIYVLVKKPDDIPEINIPTPAPTQPSKPEVYFIRYKTQPQKQDGPYPAAGYPSAVSPEYGAPSASPSAPDDTYGSPSP